MTDHPITVSADYLYALVRERDALRAELRAHNHVDDKPLPTWRPEESDVVFRSIPHRRPDTGLRRAGPRDPLVAGLSRRPLKVATWASLIGLLIVGPLAGIAVVTLWGFALVVGVIGRVVR